MATKFDYKQALQELLIGNIRYTTNKRSYPNQTSQRRNEIVSGQHPMATVLSCSDSRVPPEIIFDQGLGDLFVIRVAGNIATNSHILASIEYAVEHLGTPLVMILGHQNCGAITAALKGGQAEGHIDILLQDLQPAISASKIKPGDALVNAIHANVNLTMEYILSHSTIISHPFDQGKVKIVGAYYELDSGKITMISGTE